MPGYLYQHHPSLPVNRAILNTRVQDFIRENTQSDITAISLAKSPFPDVSSRELAEQADARKRCAHKLPLWYNTENIYYPHKLAVEQASSEAAARYKAGLIRGNDIADLTGGFGVDTYFFSQKALRVTHCEKNKDLSEISEYNAEVLDAKITYLNADGIEFIKTSGKTFSTIYIDPSRRVNTRKVFRLGDCEPDILKNLDMLLEHSPLILIKTSPLLDISSALADLKQVSQVHILSLKNDCKELVWVIERGFKGNEPEITCALLCSKIANCSFFLSEEKRFRLEEYSAPLEFIYEPDVALLKAGCFKLISRDYNLKKIHRHTHLYTSGISEPGFPGRKFRLVSSYPYGAFTKTNTLSRANIICRNFPLGPEDIKKKLRISDGGSDYLLFCTGHDDKLLVLHCERSDFPDPDSL